MNAAREFDLVVWGATGFTGRLVAEYLLERYGLDGSLSWAIGGRNEDKLREIRESLGDGAAELPLVTGDSHDADAMDELAGRTRVVCTTVGPYAKYGSELVAACVRAGTHYTDLCGEPQWMRQMIDEHEGAATASGALIVHACGFDSIPSDLGVFFLQREAMERTGRYLQSVRNCLKAARGGASGGTVASLLNAVEESRKNRETARILVAPYSLNPEGERHGPDGRDQSTMVYDSDFEAWTAPFVMAGINTKVVRRGHAVRGFPYGRDFRYSEAMLMGSGVSGWIKATGLTVGLGGFMLASAFAPSRNFLKRFVLPEPGEGPDAEERENGFWKFVLAGRFEDGSRLYASVTGDRDPGYGSTSKMLGEAAVCLAKDTPDIEGGFWTPASAMGDALLERLIDNAGLTFTID